MKVLSIVGARPEFIQSTPLSRALRKKYQEVLVHTGQHYDYRMSQTFFDELGIPAPDYNLEVGSGSHGRQTAEILMRLEEVLQQERPNLVIVRGDTNSTMAGALAASKLNIPIAHVEAGERSFNRQMPEEINRLVADRISDWHFCASHAAVNHLAAEGIVSSVFWSGDVMLDALSTNLPLARKKSIILTRQGLTPKQYALVTIHRAYNTDDPARLKSIVEALNQIDEKIIFPAHPRTRSALQRLGLVFGGHVTLVEPVGYYDMVVLEENARIIVTDSGGVQREAYMLCVPCITLRDETEWTETVDAGWNRLVKVEATQIIKTWFSFTPPHEHPPIFGDGKAGEKIADILANTILH